MTRLQRDDETGVSATAKNFVIMWQSVAKPRIAEGSTTIGGNRVPYKCAGSSGNVVRHYDMVFSSLKDEAVCNEHANDAGVTTPHEKQRDLG
jgi:hypothetical protein